MNRRKEGDLSALRLACVGVGVFIAVMAIFFASLPWLKGNVLWPSWGGLRSPGAILAHLFRLEYGVFSLSGNSDADGVRGLSIFLRDFFHSWNLLCPFVLIGAVRLKKAPGGNPLSCAVTGTLVMAAVFLFRAKAAAIDPPLASSVLERFEGPAAIPSVILVGLGLDWGYRICLARAGRLAIWLGWAVAGLFALFLIRSGWERGDASCDNTADVFMAAIGMELPREAVYFSKADLESFLGAPTPQGIRFPVEQGLLGNSWYYSEVATKLEPKVARVAPDRDARIMVEQLYRQGVWIVSSDVLQLWFNDHTPELLGILMSLRKPLRGQFTENTVNSALELCPFIKERLHVLPTEGHEASRQLWKYFARAYYGAERYFNSSGRKEAAALAREINRALLEGKDPVRWNAGCAKLIELFPSGLKVNEVTALPRR